MNGQLPIGVAESHATPVATLLPREVAQLSLDTNFGCARLSTGGLRCWGVNDRGQLGDGTTTSRTTPAPVPGVSGVRSVAVGSQRGALLLEDGTVWTWGDNSFGSLGDPSVPESPGYRAVAARVAGIVGAVGITADSNVTCAWFADGLVRCWGVNLHGQLGNGLTATTVPSPVLVQGLPPVTAVDAGAEHVCAIDRGGALWCWGRNLYGNLGDGTTATRLIPVRVDFR